MKYQLCAAESFACVVDLMVNTPLSILCEKTDVVVVKKDYVLIDLHAVKDMISMR